MNTKKLIKLIEELENSKEYTPDQDFFGRGFDHAKKEIVKLLAKKEPKGVKGCDHPCASYLNGELYCDKCGKYMATIKEEHIELKEIEPLKSMSYKASTINEAFERVSEMITNLGLKQQEVIDWSHQVNSEIRLLKSKAK